MIHNGSVIPIRDEPNSLLIDLTSLRKLISTLTPNNQHSDAADDFAGLKRLDSRDQVRNTPTMDDPRPSVQELKALRVVDLRQKLSQLGLPQSGNYCSKNVCPLNMPVNQYLVEAIGFDCSFTLHPKFSRIVCITFWFLESFSTVKIENNDD